MTESDDATARADLQVHTEESDGMDDALTILDAAHRRGVDIVAITDHDQTRGAHIAREAAAQANHPVEVIVGSEVTSRQGHILALWIEEPIPFFRSAAATVEAIWQQGGVAVIAHPAAVFPPALKIGEIERLVQDLAPERNGEGAPVLAVETANPIPFARRRRDGVIEANRRWSLPTTGGSDAHFHEQVGSAVTTFEGQGQAALRAALEMGTTATELRRYPRLSNIGPSRLLRQQWRGLSATPKALLRRTLGPDG
ncbi:MAG: PHP domain-containing protein [Chloroflexi bacterium]|nr:PHP domain-containing protein [Chloroflexota bacterium]MYF81867.1 PHP domain-containing protein [Chloroflexota bacterium]MYI04301.1 PHP domain-containing protein [Chloroflexota bacterium]